ncbi:MAG: hypothetical protein AB1742_10765 [bacterium]
MPRYVEKSDSSSAQTRALAAALNGKHFDTYGLNIGQRSLMRLLSFVPRDVIHSGVKLAMSSAGTSAETARLIRTEKMARWVSTLYPGDRRYGTVILGSPNGGVSHMGAVMNAPFLTTHFLVCFRHVKNVDDTLSTFRKGRRIAAEVTASNPELAAVCHYDPIHDRIPLVFITHVRFKLISLPAAYRDFIRRRLPEGGSLVVINCRFKWLQYKAAPRVTFQIGGLGGVPDEEYLEGSPRIDEYLYYQGSSLRRSGWRLRGTKHPLETLPESEWGCMPEFVESVKEFGRDAGFRVVVLSADHPERFGELAFHLHGLASRKDGEPPLFIFADCFNQVDPLANIQSRMLPLWLPYYDERSFEFARRMLRLTPPDTRTLFTIHPSFSDPFDMVPLDKWVRVFTREQPPILLGIDTGRFPYDVSCVYRFGAEIKSWSETHRDEVRSRIVVDEAVSSAEKIGIEVDIY